MALICVGVKVKLEELINEIMVCVYVPQLRSCNYSVLVQWCVCAVFCFSHCLPSNIYIRKFPATIRVWVIMGRLHYTEVMYIVKGSQANKMLLKSRLHAYACTFTFEVLHTHVRTESKH